METVVILTIEHTRPLPIRGDLDLAKVIEQRAHLWLHANDCKCDAKARIAVEIEPEESRG